MTLSFSAQLSQLPEFLSLALLHFLWQGALLAAVLGLALQWIPRRAAAVRHNLACLTLLLMLLAPPSTLVWLLASDPARQPTIVANPTAIANKKPAGALAVPATLTFPTWGDSNWLPWVSVLWLGGVFGFSLRWIAGFREVHALRTRDTHAVTPEWLDRFERLRIRMGVGAKARLLESTRVTGPLVIGWLRPVVLMPLGLLSGLPTAQVESLILHELAHIRGNDYLINLIVRFAETVLFYHPAVWWVGKQIEQEREKRCDDAVREVMGEGHSLGEALVTLCELGAGKSPVALAATGSSLGERVRRLVERDPAVTSGSRWRGLGLSFLLLTTALAGAFVTNHWTKSLSFSRAGMDPNPGDLIHSPELSASHDDPVLANLDQQIHETSAKLQWHVGAPADTGSGMQMHLTTQLEGLLERKRQHARQQFQSQLQSLRAMNVPVENPRNAAAVLR